MINLFFIKTFVAVAKTGSFRIAAERNFITQPAVSGHIRILENRLNCVLLERRGKKVVLTACGEKFLVYAQELLQLYQEAKLQVDLVNNRSSGLIRVGTIYSIGFYELKSFLKVFLRKYPNINVQLEYYQNHQIYELILNRKIDFGLVAYPKPIKGIKSNIFTKDKLVLIQSRENKIFPKKIFPLEKLNHQKFISLSSETPTGAKISRFLSAKKIYPDIVHEYDNIETLKSVTETGMGCSIVPNNTIKEEVRNKTLEILSPQSLDLSRDIAIIYPQGKNFTKAMKLFHSMLLNKFTVKYL